MRRATLSVGLALVFSGANLTAQDATIIIGSRVRVETTANRKFDGTLFSHDADAITVVSRAGMRMAVPTGAVARIRVSEGRSHAAGFARGMKYGAITGISLAGVLSLVIMEHDDVNSVDPLIVTAVTVYGTLLGGLIGAAIGAERWTTVYGRPVRVSLRPLSNGRPSAGLRIY